MTDLEVRGHHLRPGSRTERDQFSRAHFPPEAERLGSQGEDSIMSPWGGSVQLAARHDTVNWVVSDEGTFIISLEAPEWKGRATRQ